MNRDLATRTLAALVVVLNASAGLAQTPPPAANDDRWHFAITPYFWASALDGTVSFKGIPEQPVDASFGDVISNFDFGFASRFEGRKGRWGFATDLIYNNLGASIPGREVLGRFEPEVDLRQFIFGADAFYRVHQGAPREAGPAVVDVLVGARYNGMRSRLEGQEFEGTSQTFNWVDGVVGARFQAPLGRKVTFGGRGDIAGLGSDLTWQLQGELAFHLSARSALFAGYRHYDVDYDSGDGLDRKVYKIATSGPVVGFTYRW